MYSQNIIGCTGESSQLYEAHHELHTLLVGHKVLFKIEASVLNSVPQESNRLSTEQRSAKNS